MIVHETRLIGVDASLTKVVRTVGEETDIAVLEGIRTHARQAMLVAAGGSQTMKSKHLTGHAVDLGVVVDGEIRWDWPLYFRLAERVQRIAMQLEIPIRWGGCWSILNSKSSPEMLQDAYILRCKADHRRPFLDGPHFEVLDAPVSA